MVLTLIIIFLGALGMWLHFKYEIREKQILGVGLAKANGWDEKQGHGTIQCTDCQSVLKNVNTTPYCSKCQKYI